ncbi:helix-turn-helix domain-containing protein [Saccharothrix sp. Mg75]|uniref:helix-turn-helix domain-containing protein n=1 Tax=Saccharothrix sp. Mg75 TaxID=3445357 RepID=UPI003EEBFB4F
MPRVSQDHLDARRRQILDGARACFARFGYEGATVRRLEEATGLSRGAIFHHFRDKESLFLALAEDDALRMAEVVAEQGLVQVMRDLLSAPGPNAHGTNAANAAASTTSGPTTPASTTPGPNASGSSEAEHPADWLGTRLEVSRRLRTDPEFRARWAERSRQLTDATRQRLLRQREAGNLRDDVDVDVLTSFLELVLEGLVSHLAMGLPADDLEPVLDLVEESVRRHRRTG